MSFSALVFNLRQIVSEGIFSLQVFFLEQYGSFDEQGNYSATRKVPLWVNQSLRAMGQLALLVKEK